MITIGERLGASIITPPSGGILPSSNLFRGAIGVGVVVGLGVLAGAAGNALLENLRGQISNPNTGSKEKFGSPPFTGGQSSGIQYKVYGFTVDNGTASAIRLLGTFTGPILGDASVGSSSGYGGSYSKRFMILAGDPPYTHEVFNESGGGSDGNIPKISLVITSIVRVDGLPDTGGDPKGASEGSAPSGYTGSSGNSDRDRQKKLSPPPNIATPPPKTQDKNQGYIQNNFNNAVNNFYGGNTSNTSNITNNSNVNNIINNVVNLAPPTISPPPVLPKEQDKKVTPPPVTPPPVTPPADNTDIRDRLTAIGAALLGISALLQGVKNTSDNINSQTSPEALKNAAKNGTCETLNSPSCTQSLKDDIKNPINQNIDAKTASIAANQAGQDVALGNIIATQGTHTGFFNSIGSKLNDAKDFAGKVYEASKLDKIYNALTFFTVIHNAQMLSNNLLQTLESTLSQGMATIGFKDPDGNPWDINGIINTSIADFLKAKLGAATYADLDAKWKSANRIYQSGANMIYQVRSLWDSARALSELTGANLGQLMNTLKKDGVVSENAYPTKSESPLMINSPMAKLQNLEEAASHLNSITSQTYGVTETVKQIKDDKAAFDKLVEDSPLKKGIANKAAADELAAKKVASVSPALDTSNLVKPD